MFGIHLRKSLWWFDMTYDVDVHFLFSYPCLPLEMTMDNSGFNVVAHRGGLLFLLLITTILRTWRPEQNSRSATCDPLFIKLAARTSHIMLNWQTEVWHPAVETCDCSEFSCCLKATFLANYVHFRPPASVGGSQCSHWVVNCRAKVQNDYDHHAGD